MIVLLWALGGACGLLAAILIAVVWAGLGLMFGFGPPSHDQMDGMLMLGIGLGVIATIAATIYAEIWG
jgi:hypothetical protein